MTINPTNNNSINPQFQPQKNNSSKPETEKIETIRSKIGKSHEAENIRNKPIKLTRNASSHRLTKDSKTEKEDMNSKSTERWECTKRIPHKAGGFLYEFKLNGNLEEFYRSNKNGRYEENFPAVEVDYAILALDKTKNKHQCILEMLKFQGSAVNQKNFTFTEIEYDLIHKLNKLGYSSETRNGSFYLTLPDRVTILANWNTLKEIENDLPSLELASGDGIADDMEFVIAYLTSDALLSNNREFVHDSIAHVIPALSNKLSYPDFAKLVKQNIVKNISKSYRKIQLVKNKLEKGKIPNLSIDEEKLLKENISVVTTMLGIFTDYLSSVMDYNGLNNIPFDLNLGDFLNLSPSWQNYLQKRYGKEELKPILLKSIWDTLNKAEYEIDNILQ